MNLCKPDYLNYKTRESSVLIDWLRESVDQTLQNIGSLSDEQWDVPALEILNPPSWELGHLTWFHEFWVHRLGQTSNSSYSKSGCKNPSVKIKM